MKISPQPEYKTQLEFERYVCDFVTRMWLHCEMETQVDRQSWTQGLNLFAGKMEWGEDRADNEWMAQPFLHEFSVIVRRVAERLSNLIFEREDFFNLEPGDSRNEGDHALVQIFNKVIKYDLENFGLQTLFYEYCITGGCTGLGILKVFPRWEVRYSGETVVEEVELEDKAERKQLANDIENKNLALDQDSISAGIMTALDDILPKKKNSRLVRDVKPKRRLELVFDGSVVDPRNFAFEPDCAMIQKSQYKIERMDKKFYELENMFESGVFNKDKREELLGSAPHESHRGIGNVSNYSTQKLNTRDQYFAPNEFVPRHELLWYNGPLLGKDGRIIKGMENMMFVVGNSRVLLKARKNPFYDQEDSYIVSTFSKIPLKPTGAGVADNSKEQQVLINDLFGTFIDMLRLAVYSPTVIDDTSLREPEEVEEGMYPGMVIKTFGKKADEVFSKPRYDSAPAPWLFQTLNMLSQSSQRSASVDVSPANPASRTRITAKEIDSNVNRSDDSVLTLGRELDNNFLKPLIRKIVNYRLQFGFEKNALDDLRLQGVISEQEFQSIVNIPKIERYNEINKNYKIKVKGFRHRLERQVHLRNINDFLEKIATFPPEVLQKLDFANMLKDIVEAYGFDQDRWLAQNTPHDAAYEENKILAENKPVGILEEEEHGIHVPVHVDAWLKKPTQALLQHIAMHLDVMARMGEPIPELPEEIMAALGITPEELAAIGGQRPRLEAA